MALKVGDLVYIQSFKHDGSHHRTWSSATILDVDLEKVVLITYKTWVIEANGRRWFTREPAICFFYFKRWYNVIAMLRNQGIYYYCNLASPLLYDGEALKNIDYDLDYKVFPDASYVLLDEDEFIDHQRMMNYGEVLVDIIEDEKQRLKTLIEARAYPFNEKLVQEYFNRYLHLDEWV